jgi:hypothetical protein
MPRFNFYVDFASMGTPHQVAANYGSLRNLITTEHTDMLHQLLSAIPGLDSVTPLEPNQLVLRIKHSHSWATVMPEVVAAFKATFAGIKAQPVGLEIWFTMQDLTHALRVIR